MTILNLANDGLPNILAVIYEYLLDKGPKSDKELKEACIPSESTVEEKDKVKLNNTLKRWEQLGLFTRATNAPEHLDISPVYRLPKETNFYVLRERLPSIVCKVALSEDNNRNFWEAEKSACADFSRGLSWLLSQDIYTLKTNNDSEVKGLEIQQVKTDRRMFQNDVRWNGLQTWANFLGFGYYGHSLVIDPTKAVKPALDEVFAEQQEMSLETFIDALAERLPVLDRGQYRREIEENLDPQSWKKLKDDEISTSLSRALLSLEMKREIRLETRQDSALQGIRTMSLIGREGRVLKASTHIARIVKEA